MENQKYDQKKTSQGANKKPSQKLVLRRPPVLSLDFMFQPGKLFMKIQQLFLFLVLYITGNQTIVAQTGSTAEPVRYIGGVSIDPSKHEGGLRYAIGVENIQTMRANRTHPEYSDDCGWTYNHASNLAYWNGTFYQQYLSNPVDEHVPPGQTLLIISKDGRNWEKPQVIFPPYQAPEGVQIPDGYTGYMMHQRMGFYVAPNGRLLTIAFYAHSEHPFKEGGIGRVVREIYKDGSWGPIYFIRYDSHTNWNETNTSYPFYKSSPDEGFISACDSLLADKLKTLQWWEEDNGLDGFYSFKKSQQALSWYHRKDGKIVALWKHSYCALSDDRGTTFSDPVKANTLVMSGGKMWGQQTEDGKYAISYNPIDQTEYRYPMGIITSDDGIVFDNLLLVQGELPPRRFFGRWKDFGPCYMRGITEGNGNPPGTDMWMTYSMNKEDIWVCRIPTPIRYKIETDVEDHFDDMVENGNIIDWNIYSPKWAPVSLKKLPDNNVCLRLEDRDACDYARAVRVFREGTKITASWKVMAVSTDTTQFDIDISDQFGNSPVRISFDKDGYLKTSGGSRTNKLLQYETNKWYSFKIEIDASDLGNYSLFVDGQPLIEHAPFIMAVKSLERISFRTGPYRDWPNRKTPNQEKYPPLAGADEPQPLTVFLIDDVEIKTAQ